MDAPLVFGRSREFLCWSAWHGHGSFLVFDCGRRLWRRALLPASRRRYQTGSVHLWISMTGWQIFADATLLLDWDGPRSPTTLGRFRGERLEEIRRVSAARVDITFSGGLSLRLRSYLGGRSSKKMFMLFTAGRSILSYAPRGGFTTEKYGSAG